MVWTGNSLRPLTISEAPITRLPELLAGVQLASGDRLALRYFSPGRYDVVRYTGTGKLTRQRHVIKGTSLERARARYDELVKADRRESYAWAEVGRELRPIGSEDCSGGRS